MARDMCWLCAVSRIRSLGNPHPSAQRKRSATLPHTSDICFVLFGVHRTIDDGAQGRFRSQIVAKLVVLTPINEGRQATGCVPARATGCGVQPLLVGILGKLVQNGLDIAGPTQFVRSPTISSAQPPRSLFRPTPISVLLLNSDTNSLNTIMDVSDTSPRLATFDDFLNLDLAPPSQDGSTSQDMQDLFSPQMSSASPSSAASFLPSTPATEPEQTQTVLDTLNPNHIVFNELYNTYIAPLKVNESYSSSVGTAPLQSLADSSAFPFGDLFATYGGDLFQPIGAATTNVGATNNMSFPFAIDPQLVASSEPSPSSSTPVAAPAPAPTPAPAKPAKASAAPRQQSIAEEDEDSSDEEDEDDDDLASTLGSKRGGKAKGSKKSSGGVSTGGIVKRTGVTSCVVRDENTNDPEDWRPTAEEYKKLSSKEKRQLRNKISARNFRVRRKEYITTLEGQISDRDNLIAAIRDELGAQKLENAELRQEIDNLKKAMLEGRAPPPTGLPPPNATSDLSVPRRTSALAKANTNKDIGSSGSNSFWGGANVGMGGITSVHTTQIPELVFPSTATVSSLLSEKGLLNGFRVPMATAALPRYVRSQQENINPNLNPNSSSSSSSSDTASSSSDSESSPAPSTPPQSPPNLNYANQPWNAFNDTNPFTIKAIDSYRLQLWKQMAAAGHVPLQPATDSVSAAAQAAAHYNNSNALTGSLRPAWFTTPTDKAVKKEPVSPSLSAVLAGKTAASLASSSHPTPPTSPLPKPSALPTTPQQQQLAASVFSRMGSAFWDAFSTRSKEWDAEKVRKVLEGKAVVRVVDLEPSISEKVKPSIARSKSVDAAAAPAPNDLEEKMKSLSLNTGLSKSDRDLDSTLSEGRREGVKPALFKLF